MAKYVNLVLIFILSIQTITSSTQYERNVINISNYYNSLELSHVNLYKYLMYTNPEHPDIIYAQAILESGNFTSRLCKDANNLFGMKMPYVRTHLATSKTTNGYAKFDSWQLSVDDYILWQQQYATNKSKDEYLSYLGRVYAEDPQYTKKISNLLLKHEILFNKKV